MWLLCPVFVGFSSCGTVAAWGSYLCNPWLVAFNEKGRVMMARLSLTSVAMGVGSTDQTVQETGKMVAATLV
jgi:hypothetical protein